MGDWAVSDDGVSQRAPKVSRRAREMRDRRGWLVTVCGEMQV